jgi:hypothetical protein
MTTTFRLLASAFLLVVGLVYEGFCGVSQNGVDSTLQASTNAEIRMALDK